MSTDFIHLHMAFSSILTSNLSPICLRKPQRGWLPHICPSDMLYQVRQSKSSKVFYCSMERAKCKVFILWQWWAKVCTECYLIPPCWVHVQFLWAQVFWYLSHSIISKITKTVLLMRAWHTHPCDNRWCLKAALSSKALKCSIDCAGAGLIHLSSECHLAVHLLGLGKHGKPPSICFTAMNINV